MTSTAATVLETAADVADEVLHVRALAVDRGTAPLAPSLDAVAASGLYGLHAPTTAGGLDADASTAGRVTELLAGGCLTTALVWTQHQGVVRRLTAAGGPLAQRHLAALASGRLRAGVAVGGIRPDRERPVRAARTSSGWSVTGVVPWVTGWGHVEVLLVAALEADGDVVWLLADAPAVDHDHRRLTSSSPTTGLDRVDLVACDAANSAVVRFTGHEVPADRLVTTQAHDDWLESDAAGLRGNGSLALGVATRCARLADARDLDAEIADVRARLDAADTDGLPDARAAATTVVWRAARRLLVSTGSRGVGADQHAQRLVREAALLQVFATRPGIRAAQLAELSATGRGRDSRTGAGPDSRPA